MSIVKSFSFPEGEIRGDMYYIQHGTNNFTVIDCYLKDGNGANARRNEIINEIKHMSNGRICRFISTHPDNDHIAGIEYLDDNWEILNFYAVENDCPGANDDSFSRYRWLLDNRNCAVGHGLRRAWLNDSSNERGSSGITFQWPDLDNQDFKNALQQASNGVKINNICPIFTYSIQDGATYMWMGDLETEMQQIYYDEYSTSIPQVDILFQPHHGRKSGAIPDELLNALNPKLIIIGNAPSEHINYGDSRYTITQNTAGDIYFDNDGSEVHVYTKHKINNNPACLRIKPNKGDKIKLINGLSVDWYYAGTLTVK